MTDTVEGLLGRYVNYLDLGNAVFSNAKYISVQAASKTEIHGRTYPSIAAGVLYLTCVLFEKRLGAKDLAEVAGVTDSTIKLYVAGPVHGHGIVADINRICKKVAARLDSVIKPEWVSSPSPH